MSVYESTFTQGPLSLIDALPHQYLVDLALAAGIYETVPGSQILATYGTSRWWLRRHLRRVIHDMSHGDAALVPRDGDTTPHNNNNNNSITNIKRLLTTAIATTTELADACRERCLPVTDAKEVGTMRECLANHINAVMTLKRHVAKQRQRKTCSDRTETIEEIESRGLFLLHLAIWRDPFVTIQSRQ